jgi:NADP-dependent 3-hydroxy acid dehydrogenase YdfG
MSQKNNQVWFITGANKGLGAAIAKEALDRGYNVVATARKTEGMEKILGNSQNLLIVKLDITNDEQVQTSVEAARTVWAY